MWMQFRLLPFLLHVLPISIFLIQSPYYKFNSTNYEDPHCEASYTFPIPIGLPIKTLNVFLSSYILTTCLAHHTFCRSNHLEYIRWTVQTMKYVIVKPSPLPILMPFALNNIVILFVNSAISFISGDNTLI